MTFHVLHDTLRVLSYRSSRYTFVHVGWLYLYCQKFLGLALYLTENIDCPNYKEKSRRDIIDATRFSCRMDLKWKPQPNFTKIFPLGFVLCHVDKPTDGWIGITRPVVAFRNWFANAPKKILWRLFRRLWLKSATIAKDCTPNTLH
jgi:hypothetical protein